MKLNFKKDNDQKRGLPKRRKWIKRSLWIVTGFLVFLNIIAIFHSYKFTHFNDSSIEKTKSPKKLSTVEKLKTLAFGVNNPRPENTIVPSRDFEIIKLKSNREIECWHLSLYQSKGTVILFHGFGGSKSTMIERARIFN